MMMPVPMNSLFLHCMWSDQKSRLSVTHVCELLSFTPGWTFARARPVWTIGSSVPVLDPCLTLVGPWLICGSFVGFYGPLVNFWLDHCWTVLDSWVKGTLSLLHVIIHGRWLMCMRSHSGKIQWKMGCWSLIYAERG